MTLSRIQALESLGFEWKPDICRYHGSRKKPSLDADETRVRERTVESLEHTQTTAQTQEDFSGREIRKDQVDVSFEAEESNGKLQCQLGRPFEGTCRLPQYPRAL
jgi:hypothetical protein